MSSAGVASAFDVEISERQSFSKGDRVPMLCSHMGHIRLYLVISLGLPRRDLGLL